MRSIVTRFAPSPTGNLHIGGVRTALFNYLFAKKYGGKFLLRIEDTDKERSKKEFLDDILQGLSWLNILPSEAPVIQSRNFDRHASVVEELLQTGNAYYCWLSSEELEDIRQRARAEKCGVGKYRSPWRYKSNDEVSTQKRESNINPVVRFKIPDNTVIEFSDLVLGKMSVCSDDLEDFVIQRSEESMSTYMLAVVVDDNDMGVSHVIRGVDHLSNTFKQKVIYDALEWNVPEFAHIPLVHGEDGAKMSKRHGATNVCDYKDMGFLSEAMCNYLMRLGWGCGDNEIINMSQAIELFSIDGIGASSAQFDMNKLHSLNNHYIKNKFSQELLVDIILLAIERKDRKNLGIVLERIISNNDIAGHIANIKDGEFGEFEFLLNAEMLFREKVKNKILSKLDNDEIAVYIALIDVFKIRSNSLSDIYVGVESIVNADSIAEEANDFLKSKGITVLKKLVNLISNISEWSLENINIIINDYCKDFDLKKKDVFMSLRAAVVGKLSSPSISDVIYILGKEEVVKRIEKVLN